jgi:hypothetical protein
MMSAIKNKTVVILVCIQIVVIALLFFSITKRTRLTSSPLNRKMIRAQQSDSLKYYYEMAPNETQVADAKWLTHTVVNSINTDGLNERFDYSVKKEKGIYRIITLGDSYTFGMNVNTKDNWTELLEDELNAHYTCDSIKKYEVINLGVYSYDTQYEIERYKQRGQKYNPDLVIWMMFDYDRDLEAMQPIINTLNKFTYNELVQIGKRELGTLMMDESNITRKEEISLAVARMRTAKKFHGASAIQYQKNLLNSFNQYYQGPIVFIDLGMSDKDYTNTIFTDQIKKQHNYLLQTNVLHNSLNILPDFHLNENGHKQVMREILDYLIRVKLSTCIQ